MGRGASKAGGGARRRRIIGGGLKRKQISRERDMLSEPDIQSNPAYDGFLQASRKTVEDFGDAGLAEQFMIARIKGDGANSIIAYYGPSNRHVALNEHFLKDVDLDVSYDEGVKSGFHPSRGKKSGSEAVAAHELGHAITDAIADKMGLTSPMRVHEAAQRIIDEARKTKSGKTKVSQDTWAGRISGYAKQNAAETIAEAYADVYCNRTKAKKESKAIMRVVNKYAKVKKTK